MSRCILDPSYESTCPHPHLVCHHCHKRYCTSSYNEHPPNMYYCPYCWTNPLATPDLTLDGSSSCIVPGCENRTNQIQFDGHLCLPCADFIRGKKSPFSQAYRNEVARFREWLAKMQEALSTAGNFTLSIATTDTRKEQEAPSQLHSVLLTKDHP